VQDNTRSRKVAFRFTCSLGPIVRLAGPLRKPVATASSAGVAFRFACSLGAVVRLADHLRQPVGTASSAGASHIRALGIVVQSVRMRNHQSLSVPSALAALPQIERCREWYAKIVQYLNAATGLDARIRA